MKTLDEVIKANECCDHGEPDSRCEDCPYNGLGACCHERESDALHYLKELKSYVMGEKSRFSAFGKRLNDNVAVLPEGVYCNVCGTRLDFEKDEEDENAG